MCGFFGILQGADRPIGRALFDAAQGVQAHRGPDDRGLEVFEIGEGSLTLAHQRLSILDLSDAGHQPMSYGADEGSLVYNGELYNYLELRAELVAAGEVFRSQTDSEVVLASLHRWGTERALEKFNWMGALVWFDRRRNRLVLACDAGSEKPLYYYSDGPLFVFASEVKTVLTLLGRRLPLDRETVGQFVFQGLSDASTRTFFRGITRLAAGTYAELDVSSPSREVRPHRYTPPVYDNDPTRMPFDDFVDELREHFIDAVKLRLRSDVPVGVLLSGGIDSSSIAAVTHGLADLDSPPQLLSAISEDPRFDESYHIGVMEKHLRQPTTRITLRTPPDKLEADLSMVNWFNDAPVAGLSALAHFRLMERARELGLKVVLSGQGADELLLGYRKFLGFYVQSLVREGRPFSAAAVLTRFILNGTIVNQFALGDAKRYLPFLRRRPRWLRGRETDGSVEGPWLRGWCSVSLGLGDGTLAERQLLDVRNYSVPALCHYEDRMSMAASREIRLPFLDSRLIDMSLRAPDSFKLRNGWTKYCFRQAMARYLPPEICWRKDKKGFSNPQGEWLKRELRDSVREAFSGSSLMCRAGIVDSGALMRLYDRYCTQPVGGGSIWDVEIFAPYSLELWMRRYEAWIQ